MNTGDFVRVKATCQGYYSGAHGRLEGFEDGGQTALVYVFYTRHTLKLPVEMVELLPPDVEP